MRRADGATVVLASFTLVATAVAVLGPGSPIANAALKWRTERAQRVAVERDWALLGGLGRHLEKRIQSDVIMEFSDYECPYCRSADVIVGRWLDSRPSTGVVYLNFPLPIHFHANAAARAAECAGRQGRFREMHHELMSTSLWPADTNWVREAVLAGVRDTVRFRSCVNDSATMAWVDAAVRLGESLGVQGTPTFIGRRWRHVGVVTEQDLDRLADRRD